MSSVIDPDLQERSNLPCDTGSGRVELNEAFLGLNFGGLEDEWFVKEGLYAADDVAVAKRAQRFRERLRDIIASLEKDGEEADEGRKRNVVVVTYPVNMPCQKTCLATPPTYSLWRASTTLERYNLKEQPINVHYKRAEHISEPITSWHNASCLPLNIIFSTTQYAFYFKGSQGNLGP